MLLEGLTTVFETRGISGVISAHTRLAAMQQKVDDAQKNLATTFPSTWAKYQAASRKVEEAQKDLNKAIGEESLKSAAKWVAMSGVIILTLDRMIDRYVAFSSEVRKISQLTGASAQDSVQAAVLQRVAGISDVTEIRELLRSGSSVFDAKGQGALGMLGISSNPSQSGLSLINQIADRLQSIPDGLRKTRIMEDIFGQRGVAAMLPVLQMTKQQREAITDLSKAYTTQGLGAVQQYQFATGLLGQTWQQDVIFPLVNSLLPALTRLIDWATKFGRLLGGINTIFHGVPAWITSMVLLGVVFAGLYKGVMLLVTAYRALAVGEAIAKAVAGDWSGVAVLVGAGAIAAGAFAGIDAAMSKLNGDQLSNAAETQMRAATKMESAINRMGDMFDDLRGRNVPGGLSSSDISQVRLAGGLPAIG